MLTFLIKSKLPAGKFFLRSTFKQLEMLTSLERSIKVKWKILMLCDYIVIVIKYASNYKGGF